MNYSIFFTTKCFITADSYISHTKNYEFSKYIVSSICKIAIEFEIRCWPGELLAMETGEKYGMAVFLPRESSCGKLNWLHRKRGKKSFLQRIKG